MSKKKLHLLPFPRNLFPIAFLLVFGACTWPEGVPSKTMCVNIIVSYPNNESPSSFRPEFSLDQVEVLVNGVSQTVELKGNLFLGRFVISVEKENSISVKGLVGGKTLFVSAPEKQIFSVTESESTIPVTVVYLPFVKSVDPADGKASVSANKPVLISFSAAVDTSSVDSTSVILREANAAPVPGVFRFLDSTRVMFVPEKPLNSGQSYSLFINDNIKGKGKKNSLIRSHSAYFSTK